MTKKVCGNCFHYLEMNRNRSEGKCLNTAGNKYTYSKKTCPFYRISHNAMLREQVITGQKLPEGRYG